MRSGALFVAGRSGYAGAAMAHPVHLESLIWIVFAGVWFVAALFVKRARYREPRLYRVIYGVALTVGFLLVFLPSFRRDTRIYDSRAMEWVGVVVTAAGFLLALYARFTLGRNWSGAVTLKEGHRLITVGPYRFVRHPIYTALLVSLFGTALTASTLFPFLGMGLIAACLLVKLRQEERLMAGAFPEEYPAYRSRTWALLPFLY